MSSVLRKLARRADPVARIAFNMRPVKHPWGGGNWWLTQVVRHLRAHGYEVTFDLAGELDGIVLVDPRVGGNVVFGAREIADYKRRRPKTRCLHRVNECDLRKGTNEIDALLADANAVADHTVFISRWLRDYHAERWFDRSLAHDVVHNGADPAVFHPIGGARFEGGTLRLATHHWSDNPMKGFDVYEQVDGLIASRALADAELWVIGRWPAAVEWRSARTFPPATGPELAGLLRQCHVYLTASRFEPGGMHHVEGAQCGLPVLYHEDGGGIGETADSYGISYRDDVGSAVQAARGGYADLRRRVLAHAPSGDAMCAAYRAVVQRMLSADG